MEPMRLCLCFFSCIGPGLNFSDIIMIMIIYYDYLSLIMIIFIFNIAC